MNSVHRLTFTLAAALAAGGAFANQHDHASQPAAAPAAAAQTWTDAEVRKVDKGAAKVTLKHGPITNLDMPGMTMAFPVADPRLLDAVKAGDKVRFTAENVGGAITVTALEAVR